MLTAAIERIAAQSLEEVLRERIFTPLGMYNTLLRRWDTDFVSNSATLHMTTADGGYDKSYLGTELTGEGGMVSTADDMLRWLAHMDTPVVGSKATWETMKAPQILSNGTSTGYGLGLMSGQYRGAATLSHPGGVHGGNSQMIKVPAAGLDVLIMVNRGDVLAMTLADRVLDVCLLGLDGIDEASNGPFANGTFRSPTSGRVIQLFPKEKQQIVSIEGFDMPVKRDRDGALRPTGTFGYMKQSVRLTGDPEKPGSIVFNDFGNRDDLLRVQLVEESNVALIAGRYRSIGVGVDATISDTEDGPQLLTVGRFGSAKYSLECLTDGVWRATSAMPRSGILSFDHDAEVFGFSSWLTRALPFQRVT
jgi:hypothetical protein